MVRDVRWLFDMLLSMYIRTFNVYIIHSLGLFFARLL